MNTQDGQRSDLSLLGPLEDLDEDQNITRYYNGDQVGLVKNWAIMHLTWLSCSRPTSMAALSQDAGKAFDRAECECVEFPHVSHVQVWIQKGIWSILSNTPEQQSSQMGRYLNFLVSHYESEFLELLAMSAWMNTDIKGMHAGGKEHRFFMYADDILVVVVANENKSLPIVFY